MSESVIKLTNIQKSYGKHKVLHDVSINIEKGGIYGLIGRNGAGKSTMFKVILGLSDYQGGTVEIMGSSDNLEKARKNIGFLIGNNIFNNMSARDNLLYYSILKGIEDKEKEVERVLEIVGLSGVKTKAGGFSLGMKQRLGIANAILGNPEIVILDEPTNGLDPQGIMDVRNTIKDLNEKYGMTVIVSSHILNELQNTAHKFAILNNGSVVKELSQEELQIGNDMVSISVNDFDKAKEVLEREGIRILGESHGSKSLEDYYFELVGGGKDA